MGMLVLMKYSTCQALSPTSPSVYFFSLPSFLPAHFRGSITAGKRLIFYLVNRANPNGSRALSNPFSRSYRGSAVHLGLTSPGFFPPGLTVRKRLTNDPRADR